MRLLSLILAVITTFSCFGASNADSVNVHFLVGHRRFDPSLGNNREVMNGFIEKVREAVAADDVERIEVHGYASPDGLSKANEILARNRCNTIAEYIIKHAGVNPDLIDEKPSGIGWDRLRSLVAENPDVPYKDKVLDILENTPVWIYGASGKVVDGRKKRLMDLAGGRPYNWLYVHIFPELRNAVAVTLYRRTPDPVATETDAITPDDVLTDSITVIDSTHGVADEIQSTDSEVSVGESIDKEADGADGAGTLAGSIEYYKRRRHFALKTNLLYDAVLLPNLELQWQINPQWSVSLEGDVAWWSRWSSHRSYRLAVISPEVRYHIRPKGLMHGLYVGALAGGGWYQLQWETSRGYRGEGFMAGVSGGYMWPISRSFSLDAEIGFGYLHTRYKRYESRAGHQLYQFTKSMDYVGPVKLKLSIAWRFDIVTKKVKNNSSL